MEMNYQRFNDEEINNKAEDNEKLNLIDNEYKYNDLEQNIIKKPMKVPEFVINNTGFCEKTMTKILCCAKYKSRDKIDQEHLKAYYSLKDLALVLFNEQIEQHENTLKSLFVSALNLEASENLESPEWKSIGFQSHNPRTDFRAGGYLSLLFLNFFVVQYKDEFDKMNHIDCFMTAVSAIRLTFLFKISFNMLEREDEYSFLTKQYKLDSIEVSHFKSFLRLQSQDRNFIFDNLSKCLITAKNNFIKQYDQELGIRNIHFLDSSVDQAFKNVFFSVIKKAN